MSKTFKETLQSGCLTLLLVFLVGLGSCVGLIGGSVGFDYWKNDRFLSKLEDKVKNNTATADEYVFYTEAFKNHIFDEKNKLSSTELKAIENNYLQKAVALNNREAKFLSAKNIIEAEYHSPTKNFTVQKQAVETVNNLLIESCDTHLPFIKPKPHTYEGYPAKTSKNILEESIFSSLNISTISNEHGYFYPDFYVDIALINLFNETHCPLQDGLITSLKRYNIKNSSEDYQRFKKRNNINNHKLVLLYTLEKITAKQILPVATQESDLTLQKQLQSQAEILYQAYLKRYPLEKYPVTQF